MGMNTRAGKLISWFLIDRPRMARQTLSESSRDDEGNKYVPDLAHRRRLLEQLYTVSRE